jgi:hypothetical protein
MVPTHLGTKDVQGAVDVLGGQPLPLAVAHERDTLLRQPLQRQARPRVCVEGGAGG